MATQGTFQAGEWTATPEGVTYPAQDTGGWYFIDYRRMLRFSSEALEWPAHMAEKEWVHYPDFEAAFLVALAMSPAQERYSAKWQSDLCRALHTARKVAERTRKAASATLSA